MLRGCGTGLSGGQFCVEVLTTIELRLDEDDDSWALRVQLGRVVLRALRRSTGTLCLVDEELSEVSMLQQARIRLLFILSEQFMFLQCSQLSNSSSTDPADLEMFPSSFGLVLLL